MRHTRAGASEPGPERARSVGRSWRGTSALAALSLVSACGRANGCWPGEKVYARLDAKHDVEHVRTVRWSCLEAGSSCGPMTRFALRIHTSPVQEVGVPCAEIELGEHEDGSLVAYRCVESGRDPRWTLVRLGTQGPALHECGALGEGDRPDFGRVEPLSRSWGRVLGCEPLFAAPEPDVRAALVARTLAAEGGPATRTALVSAMGQGHYAPPDDPWLVSLASLPPSERAALTAEVCEALASADASTTALARGTRVCALDRPEHESVVLARLGERLTRERSPTDDPAWAEVLSALAAASLVHAAPRAGELGCKALATLRGRNASAHDHAVAIAALLVARAKATCPAVAAWAPATCGYALDCGEEEGARHLCTKAELERDLSAWGARAPEGGLLPHVAPPDALRALLSAAYTQGELSTELLTRNARRRYAQTAEKTCERTPHGEPCVCTEDLLCLAPPSASEASVGTCALRFDDAAKKVTATRTCQGPGAPCGPAGTQSHCCGFCKGAEGAGRCE